VVVQLTIAAWLALEAGLMIRDRVRGKGSAARDRGTLRLNIIIITAAVVAAGVLIHRIFVEEAVLTEVTGRAYTDDAARTKRLVPGLW